MIERRNYMNCVEFVIATVMTLETELSKELKDSLLEKYIPLNIIKKEEISFSMLGEKICDYFNKTELATGKNFEKLVKKYASDLDSVVGSRIAREPKPRKNRPTPPTSRARKYYEKAQELEKHDLGTCQGLMDYTRLMLCLYSSIINNSFKEIEDFDYSVSAINLNKIIESMRKETVGIGKKPRFDTADRKSVV